MRARFLTDEEIATGYYSASIVAKRREVIKDGETLYQDMREAHGKPSTPPV